MRLLYGAKLAQRNRVLAELIPDGASVVDLCCGPPMLFEDHLKAKGVSYLGIDINPVFVSAVERSGAQARLMDLRHSPSLPKADFVIMQGSLYHFLPEASALLDRMLAAARLRVVVSEPVRNLSQSSIPGLAKLAAIATDAGDGPQYGRFDEESLDALFRPYAERLVSVFPVAGGRERIVVLRGAEAGPP